MLFQPVSIIQLITIKMIFRYVLLTLSILLICLLALVIAGVPLLVMNGLFFGLAAAYSLFWFLLAYLLNLWNRSSVMNAGLLFLAWVFWMLIIPTTLSVLADAKFSMPSRVGFVNEMRETMAEVDREASQQLARYYYDHPELAPQDTVQKQAGYM